MAIPVGYLIAWLARDELIVGRKWFMILIALSFLAAPTFFFMRSSAEALASLFVLIVAVISLHKSFDKKFISS